MGNLALCNPKYVTCSGKAVRGCRKTGYLHSAQTAPTGYLQTTKRSMYLTRERSGNNTLTR